MNQMELNKNMELNLLPLPHSNYDQVTLAHGGEDPDEPPAGSGHPPGIRQ